MADREKVMKALKCRVTDPVVECGNCPYNDATDDWRQRCDFHRLCADALYLLKEQEPRVMTLEELQAIETPWNRNTPPYLWMENRSGRDNRWYPVWDIRECVGMIGTRGIQNYGVVWRIWSCRPSPEQMRDTPWKGDSDAE